MLQGGVKLLRVLQNYIHGLQEPMISTLTMNGCDIVRWTQLNGILFLSSHSWSWLAFPCLHIHSHRQHHAGCRAQQTPISHVPPAPLHMGL